MNGKNINKKRLFIEGYNFVHVLFLIKLNYIRVESYFLGKANYSISLLSLIIMSTLEIFDPFGACGKFFI